MWYFKMKLLIISMSQAVNNYIASLVVIIYFKKYDQTSNVVLQN